jgi:dTDP-4-amino-4,6-dideoxygalactose transaminase
MITTSDPELYEKCYAIVNRGGSPKGRVNAYGMIGDNYQMSELAAVTLGPQLDMLDELCVQRERIMTLLDQEIEKVDSLIPLKQFEKTSCRAQMRYSFFYDASRFNAMSRDQFIQKAHSNDIPLMRGYHSVSHDARLFQRYASDKEYPVAQMAQESVISIHHTDLLRGLEYWAEVLNRLRNIIRESSLSV